MVNDAFKKHRESIAFALLAVSALWFVGALILLFKDANVGFSTRSSIVGGMFESPLSVLSIVVAVLLVTRWDNPTENARLVALGALTVAGLDLLFGIISFFAQFGAAHDFGFIGIALAGRAVGALLGLAALLFLGAAFVYVYFTVQSLPATTAQQPPQWAGGPGYGYGYGQPGQPGQQPGGAPQGWAPGQVWAPGQSGGQTAAPGSAAGYGQPPASGWSTPSPYGWAGAGQAGQAPGWPGGQPHAGGSTAWPPPQPQGGWGQPQPPFVPEPQGQQQWGQPGSAAPADSSWQWPSEQEQETQPAGWVQPSPTYGDAPADAGQPPPEQDWWNSATAAAAAEPFGAEPSGGAEPDSGSESAAAPEEPGADLDQPVETGDGVAEGREDPTDEQQPRTDSGWWQHPRG